EARTMGLVVEQPDVDESAADFTVHVTDPGWGSGGAHRRAAEPPGAAPPRSDGAEISGSGPLGKKKIRFGMGAVKGVGLSAVEAILEARKDGGPFQSLYDFCRRVDSQKANRRVIEQLVKAGAFDAIAARGQHHRAQLLAALDAALEHG